MSVEGWQTVLVLGGIRSGKSVFAESLVADAAAVTYVATAAGAGDDAEWLDRIEAHQRRRPQSWATEETGGDPARLTALLAEAKPDDVLLVDDLGGWVAGLLDPARQPNDDEADVAALAAAVRGCAGRVVLVSPEVGLSLVPVTPVGRAFADALGSVNQAVAAACDRVAFVVAGRATWLAPSPDARGLAPAADAAVAAPPEAPVTAVPATSPDDGAAPGHAAGAGSGADAGTGPAGAPVSGGAARPAAPDRTAPVGGTVGGTVGGAAVPAGGGAGLDGGLDVAVVDPEPAPVAVDGVLDLPATDGDAGPDARDRMAALDLPGSGFGALGEAVEFTAAVQGTAAPRPWTRPRVLVLSAAHAGGVAAGDDPADAARRVDELAAGRGALARLAATAGADVRILRLPGATAVEDGPALGAAETDAALGRGWALAEAAAAEGRDVLVLASLGAGTDAVATAVLAATTGVEAVAVLPRVHAPGGVLRDDAWIARCAAVRDALHRIRREPTGPRDILVQLGGADVAAAVGVLLGAATRRLPVLLDGPVGAAAALVARDLGGPAREWCLLPDDGGRPLLHHAADVLGLTPVLDLGLDLGEGANALAALPLIGAAVGLAGALPVHPAMLAAQHVDAGDDEA